MPVLTPVRGAILPVSTPATKMREPNDPSAGHPVLLYDGVCSLCDASVLLVIDRDPAALFRFASLQSDVGSRIAAQHGVNAQDLDTVVLVADGRAFVRSDAVLGVASRLGRPWSWLRVLRAVPQPLRDAVYRLVARNRLRWFGRRDACRIPTPDLRARFLDS